MKALGDTMRGIFDMANTNLTKFTRGRMRTRYDGCGLVSLAQITSASGEEERVVAAVGMTLMADPLLRMVMIFPIETRQDVVRILLGPDPVDDQPLIDSVIQEVGNIFGSAFANGLSRHLNEPVKTSPPEVAMDLAGALLASVVGSIATVGDDVLMVNMEMLADGASTPCSIHMFFDDFLRERLTANRSNGQDI